MCLIDYQIGRHVRTTAVAVTLTGGTDVILPPNRDRVTLVLNNGWANSPVDFILEGQAGSQGQLVSILAAGGAVVLTLKDHGDLVQRGVSAFGIANDVVTVSEGTLPESVLSKLLEKIG